MNVITFNFVNKVLKKMGCQKQLQQLQACLCHEGSAWCWGREPREEDVQQIMTLKRTVKEHSAQIKAQSAQLEQIRAEVLLREDNYNKTFANGGTGPAVLGVDRALTADENLSNWMLKKPVRSPSKQSRTSVARTTSLSVPRTSF